MKKNILSLIICGFFILSSILSLSFIVIEAAHDCYEDDCPICLHIKQIVDSIKQTSKILFSAIAALFLFTVFIFKRPSFKDFVFFKHPTLILLKVIMND